MAITISDTEPRVQYTATSGQTSFSVPFEFFTVSDIKVFNGNTQLSFNASPSSASQYSVTGAAVSGGGSITLGGGATLNDTITIFRDLAVARSTDFPTSGAFQIDSLNTELDKIIAMIQQVERDLKFSPKAAATTANTFNLTFPNLVANKFLTVNPGGTALEFTQDVTNVNTVAGIASNIVSVSNIAANVTTVAGVNAAVTTVANNIGSVNTVAADITKVIAVANDLAEAVSEVETVADDLNETTSEIEVVAGAITNVNNVGNSITNVNSVAGALTNINNLNATNVIANIGTVAGIQGQVVSVSGISSTITAVNNNSTNINSVHSNANNINTVAGLNTEITNLNNLSTEITNLNGIRTAISGVNSISATVSAVNSNATNINSVNANSTNINLVAGDITNVNQLAGALSLETTFAVTVTNPGSGNVFVIDGTNNPTLTLDRGGTYIFDLSNGTNSSHPLAFKDGSGNSYTTGVTVTGVPGNAGAKVTIVVAANAPSSLRYYCTSHGNAMGNTISVVNNNLTTVASNILQWLCLGINNIWWNYRSCSRYYSTTWRKFRFKLTKYYWIWWHTFSKFNWKY